MTALDQFARLECTGLWRENENAQRLEVIVSLGEATIVINHKLGGALAHWSLPAVERISTNGSAAVFKPGPDAEEELELDDETMIDGIAQVQRALQARRVHPGRLRGILFILFLAILIAGGTLWFPSALVHYTASIVPSSKRIEIGSEILTQIHRITGGECSAEDAKPSLNKLAKRVGLSSTQRIAVLAGGTRMTAHLPGGLLLAHRELVEDFDTPETLAGFLVAENLRFRHGDPLVQVLESSGIAVTFRLLTSGEIPPHAFRDYGEKVMSETESELGQTELVSAFAQASVPTTPYAYGLDPTGETTFFLIEADPFANTGVPDILDDSGWVSLQSICLNE